MEQINKETSTSKPKRMLVTVLSSAHDGPLHCNLRLGTAGSGSMGFFRRSPSWTEAVPELPYLVPSSNALVTSREGELLSNIPSVRLLVQSFDMVIHSALQSARCAISTHSLHMSLSATFRNRLM